MKRSQLSENVFYGYFPSHPHPLIQGLIKVQTFYLVYASWDFCKSLEQLPFFLVFQSNCVWRVQAHYLVGYSTLWICLAVSSWLRVNVLVKTLPSGSHCPSSENTRCQSVSFLAMLTYLLGKVVAAALRHVQTHFILRNQLLDLWADTLGLCKHPAPQRFILPRKVYTLVIFFRLREFRDKEKLLLQFH